MKIVIAGNGVAAQRAAMEIYKTAPESEVVLIAKEKYGPYSRIRLPELIKGSLAESAFTMNGLKTYQAKGLRKIEENEVVSIDRAGKTVTLKSGDRESYDKLILAVGSNPNRLPLPGKEYGNITALRKLSDALDIITLAEQKESCVVVGGGLLGLEAAAAAAARSGKRVTVLETAPYILPRQLDEKAAAFFEDLLKEKGIDIIKSAKLERYNSEDGKNVSSVSLATGDLKADYVIEAVGVRPVVDIAASAGLDTARAIKINERAETSDSDIYAIGDCAEWNGLCPGLVMFASETGRVAGANACGKSEVIKLPNAQAFIEAAGIEAFSIGNIKEAADIIVNEKDGCYEALYLDSDKKLQGVIGIGSKENMMKVQKLIGTEDYSSLLEWTK